MATAMRSSPGPAALLASVGDPEGARALTAIVVLLVALGLALVMVAIWLRRTTRPDPELLAPLEVMGDRKWRRGDPVWQRRRLDEVRPPEAEPLAPSVAPPDLDEAFDKGPAAQGFDDLHGAGVAAVPDAEAPERPEESEESESESAEEPQAADEHESVDESESVEVPESVDESESVEVPESGEAPRLFGTPLPPPMPDGPDSPEPVTDAEQPAPD